MLFIVCVINSVCVCVRAGGGTYKDCIFRQSSKIFMSSEVVIYQKWFSRLFLDVLSDYRLWPADMTEIIKLLITSVISYLCPQPTTGAGNRHFL